MLLPVDYVLFGSISGNIGGRHDCWNKIPDRDDNIIAEAWLFFGHLCSFSITKETSAHFIGFLNITLDEELVKEQIGPFSERVELARRCWKIGRMDKEIEELLLAGKLFFVIFGVND